MSISKRIILSVFALGTMMAVGRATATTITTTNFTTWKNGLVGQQFTEIDGSQFGNGPFNTSTGTSLMGFTFTGPNGGGYTLSKQSYNYSGIGLAASLVSGTAGGAGINFVTPTGGENALFLFVNGTTSAPLSLTLSDGQNFSVTTGSFGLSLSHTVTSFFLSTAGGSPVALRDLEWGASNLPQDSMGSTSAVPEAGTVTLFGMGLFLISVAGRKWTKQTPQLSCKA